MEDRPLPLEGLDEAPTVLEIRQLLESRPPPEADEITKARWVEAKRQLLSRIPDPPPQIVDLDERD